jgi:D-3-phosphoglycerate dehydrogenase
MSKVLVMPSSFAKFSEEPNRILTDAGLEIVKYVKPKMTEEEIIAHLDGVAAIIVGLESITAKVMDGGKDLKVIAKYGVGLDNIDLEAAKERNIEVVNTPGANADAVADYTFGLLISAARSISVGDAALKSNQWPRITGYPVYGATIGIVGLGAIGKGVAKRAKGFNMKIMAYDIYWDEEFVEEYGVIKASLEDIYKECDFISLHISLTEQTKDMIKMEQLKMMKSSTFIINCARGGLINETDLYTALKEGFIRGAAIDAFSLEPPTGSPLLDLDNAICTPHLAGSSFDAINNMGIISAMRVVEVLKRV